MKKSALLIALAVSALSSNAQLVLSGTSYTEDFNTIGTGLPTGWSTYNSATATSPGLIESFSSSTGYGVYGDTVYNSGECISDVYGGGFKNYASANNATAKVATCAEQKLLADRAMGVRQVSQTNASHPNLEPGAAFVLKIANTSGLANFDLTFKLQSLDTTSPRETTWVVDYATGSAPTAFTPATLVGSPSMKTGNLTFKNETVSVDFGSALDNQTSNVWIRIVALTGSTGSGNRASTAIDDFNLTWTGSASVAGVVSESAASLNVIGAPTSDKVTFAYNTREEGTYNFVMYDIAGRSLINENINAKAGTHQLTYDHLMLAPGMYFAKMTNGTNSNVVKFVIN